MYHQRNGWQSVTIFVPISVQISKKAKWHLNLNNYRNAHYQTLNRAKILFAQAVKPTVLNLPEFSQIALNYRLFPPSRREIDVNNVLTIVDKFFCDSLTETGRIPDDNYKFLSDSAFHFGRTDPENPRAEITIHGLLKGSQMRLVLQDEELKAAVLTYLAGNFPGMDAEPEVVFSSCDGQVRAEVGVSFDNLAQEAASKKPAKAPTKPRKTTKKAAADETPDASQSESKETSPAEEPKQAQEEQPSQDPAKPTPFGKRKSKATTEPEPETGSEPDPAGEETPDPDEAPEVESAPEAEAGGGSEPANDETEKPKRKSLFGKARPQAA